MISMAVIGQYGHRAALRPRPWLMIFHGYPQVQVLGLVNFSAVLRTSPHPPVMDHPRDPWKAGDVLGLSACDTV